MSDADDLKLSVSPGMMRRYLLATGWRNTSTRTDLDLFVSPGDAEDIELILPGVSAERQGAAGRALAAAMRTLAETENRDIAAVAFAIKSLGFDIIRAALPDSVVSWNSIPLRVAEEVIRHTRRLLAHAATNEISPNRIAPAINGPGEQYASSCRFAHTFQGSFGFTVESPVGPHSEYVLDEGDHPPPVERRYVQRLLRGLRTVSSAGEKSDPDLITRNFEIGFNANMCDELVAIFESAGAESVRFDFTLSPEWKPPEDMGLTTPIELGQRAVLAAKEASVRLRGNDIDPYRTIQGLVTNLASSENPADLEHPSGSREIGVIWDGELGLVKVAVRLDPRTYLEAYKAHGQGQQVEITGKLERSGRRWVLREASHFRVITG